MYYKKNGLVGIIPGGANVGDKIFIISTAKVSFVIREKPNSEYHSFIGVPCGWTYDIPRCSGTNSEQKQNESVINIGL